MSISTMRQRRQRPWRSRAPWPSAGLRYQLGQPDQIVGGCSEDKSPSDTITATEPGLLLPGDRFDPAECLLDALANALADGIAAVPGRSPINRRTAAAGVLRNMRRHPHRAQFVDEVFYVVGFVGAKRDRRRSVGTRLDHVQRSHPLGMPVSQCQAGVDQQAMTVLHQPMPDEAKLRLLAFALAVEPGIGIGGRSMGIVRAFLAMEVRFGIAPAALRRRLARAVLRLYALHRGPGFDQRDIDREVIA